MLMSARMKFFRLGRDNRGVSAVEFALIAPVMIGLYFGSVEISDGVAADRKVSLIAAALANLSAQVSTISSSDMTNILDASSAIISPYSAGNLRMTLSCIKIDANKNATVKWSTTRGGTALSGTPTLPSALQVANTQLLFAQVSYAYTPAVGYTITGTLTLSDQMYMAPRITAPTFNGTTCT
ncbi:pilus assembly protein [Pseudolabrys taiwanensis]|uniref:Pilus assembly protein n=2 Tax=Pseudolabrys taiwanensis TaxID=331696 RepID=A0A346A0V4_9HYPH|nr:pilus assembly protein [Pseudolabrys taiwanensis]